MFNELQFELWGEGITSSTEDMESRFNEVVRGEYWLTTTFSFNLHVMRVISLVKQDYLSTWSKVPLTTKVTLVTSHTNHAKRQKSDCHSIWQD